MIIYVATRNKHKLEGVRKAFIEYGCEPLKLKGIEVESGVPYQPTNYWYLWGLQTGLKI